MENARLCIQISNGEFVCMGKRYAKLSDVWEDLGFWPTDSLFVRHATADENKFWSG